MSRPRPISPRPGRKRPSNSEPASSRTRPNRGKGRGDAKPSGTRPGSSSRRNIAATPAPQTKPGRTRGELSYRTISLLVIVFVFVLFLSQPIKEVLLHEQHVRQVKAQIAQEQKRQQELKDLIAQWDDPDYVASQARARLGFVRPGETQYLVIDPQAKAKQLEQAEATVLQGPPRPWFTVISDSLTAAGSVSSITPEAPVKSASTSPTPE